MRGAALFVVTIAGWFSGTGLCQDISAHISKPVNESVIYSRNLQLSVQVANTPDYHLEISLGSHSLFAGRQNSPSIDLKLDHPPAGEHILKAVITDSQSGRQATAVSHFHVVQLPNTEWIEASPGEVIDDIGTEEAITISVLNFCLQAYEASAVLDWVRTLSVRRVGPSEDSTGSCTATAAAAQAQGWESDGPPCANGQLPHDAMIYLTGELASSTIFTFRVQIEWFWNEGVPGTNHYLMGAAPTAELTHVPNSVLSNGPIPSMSDLADSLQCRADEPQIREDLSYWRDNGATIGANVLQGLNTDPMFWCARVQIIGGRIYFRPPIQDIRKPNRQWFFEALLSTLLALAARVKLPDVDFLVGGEVPQCLRGAGRPIFSMTKSVAHEDILMPDLFFWYWDGSVEVSHPFYRPPQLSIVDHARDKEKWSKRVPKLWWKGTVDGWRLNARGQLVRMARRMPHLIEAQALRLSGSALFDVVEEEVERVPVTDQLRIGTPLEPGDMERHKYLANTHGNGNDWSNRFKALLSTESLVFKQDSTLFEFWERDIEPWQHYVPVNRNLSDIPEKIKWAQDNDERAREIAVRAASFVRTRLRMDDIYCYWARLLWEYSSVQTAPPTTPMEGAATITGLLNFD